MLLIQRYTYKLIITPNSQITIFIYGREIFFSYINILSEIFQILIYKKNIFEKMSQKVLKFKGKSIRGNKKAQKFSPAALYIEENIDNLLFMKKKRRPKGGENFSG